MTSGKFPPVLETLLSQVMEPLSDEERARLTAEWAKKRLDEILFIAFTNKDIASDLCKKAAILAREDKDLSEVIKDGLRKRNGRPTAREPWLYKLILQRYAYAVISHHGKHDVVIACVIDYYRRMEKVVLSERSMENEITKAINLIRRGKLPLGDLPPWAQPIIQARIDRGEKTKVRAGN